MAFNKLKYRQRVRDKNLVEHMRKLRLSIFGYFKDDLTWTKMIKDSEMPQSRFYERFQTVWPELTEAETDRARDRLGRGFINFE